MSPWQRSVKNRRRAFWGKLLLFSSGLHLIILFSIFFLYRGQNAIYNVVINSSIVCSAADVRYLPLRKTARPNFKAISEKKMTPKQTKPKPIPKKTKALKSTKLAKPQPKKKRAPTPVKKQKLKKQKPVKKKSTPKAVQSPKKKTMSKPAMKKEVKSAAPKKLIQLGRDDIEALKVGELIQHEVEKHWKPPAGLSKDLSCMVNMRVNWDGSIGTVTISKSSGVLIYDISARVAVSKLNLPKVARGKEINITFKQ